MSATLIVLILNFLLHINMVIASINTVTCPPLQIASINTVASPPHQAQFSSAKGSIAKQLTVVAKVGGKAFYASMPQTMIERSGKSYEDIIDTLVTPLGGVNHRILVQTKPRSTVMGL